MLNAILVGTALAFASVVQPGPLQAFLLARVASAGWRRTLPAALAPLVSDGPIALFVLVVLHRVPSGFEVFLRCAGGVVLLVFAWRSFVDWRNFRAGEASRGEEGPRTLRDAIAVNLVNPGPWVAWSLILGPLALASWREGALVAVALIASFYTVMVGGLALFILLVGATSRLRPEGRRLLLLLASLVLAALGLWSLASALI